MFKIIVVTNRHLCAGEFISRLKTLANAGAHAIILREKDLEPKEYSKLFGRVLDELKGTKTQLIAHTYFSKAKAAGCQSIHLPLEVLRQNPTLISEFKSVGVSVHSISEGVIAGNLGASYLIAGHIFSTDCKKNCPPRGTEFLNELKKAVKIPIYAIGGINKDNLAQLKQTRISGACLMSEPMITPDPIQLIGNLKQQYIN